ncbi:hypothetical protein L1787_24270 [Acuticoccus sp. M5D2P5]|uniref:hypothetical protein n=1 Tax=Acuticoccus kalidii TaxID=2910977 RepID=UPI001F28B047|nr:hypothetical protein [Acuticoccus kalidii]MCF3936511.1 hypothetical protein [Acuticoccus kalidii]
MAIHGVFISPKNKNGAAIDMMLRQRFSDVYRVGVEFWLVDTARDADQVGAVIRPGLGEADKMFIAGLTRDTFSTLSAAARAWLTAPERGWRERKDGLGAQDAEGTPFAIAA